MAVRSSAVRGLGRVMLVVSWSGAFRIEPADSTELANRVKLSQCLDLLHYWYKRPNTVSFTTHLQALPGHFSEGDVKALPVRG